MDVSAPVSTSSLPPGALHFVLLHHGYHGVASDFHYLYQICNDALGGNSTGDGDGASEETGHGGACVTSPRLVFIFPHGSDGFRTHDGVWVCARRYVEHACAIIAQELARADGDPKEHAALGTRRQLHFSAFGHSMGGLILRAAAPQLIARLEETYAAEPHHCELHWETFCTIATPHLGMRYLQSRLMTFMANHVGRHLWTAIADLFAKNTVVREDLGTEESLGAWARFSRRVLINVVNDPTVPSYSSSFLMTLDDLKRNGASLPSGVHSDSSTACLPEDDSASNAPRDFAVQHLARHGVPCAHTLEGLRNNAVWITKVSPALWPPELLTEERALAAHILRHVGPLELHLVDLRPRCNGSFILTPMPPPHEGTPTKGRTQLNMISRLMIHLGANRYSHAAMMCKPPFAYPAAFGVVSEYIASNMLGVSLSSTTDPVVNVEISTGQNSGRGGS